MNSGLINEELLREYINNNNFNSYNDNIKNFLRFLFGADFNQGRPFFAIKKAGKMKPDLCIKHNNIEKYISIKKGSGNSVHQEKIDVFFPFFEELLGSNALACLKYFHYGDDTMDDTGAIRYSANECKKRYPQQIDKINSLANTSGKLIHFLDRFLFVGNVLSAPVDVVYYGTIDSGLWATREEITRYIINNDFSLNAVHFGPLTYQVWGRDEKRKAAHPDRRYVMQIKWDGIAKDLEAIRKDK